MAKAIMPAYTYGAKVTRWVDGDTVDLSVDVGFNIAVNTRFRLYGIDTPERGQKNHDEAWRAAESLAPAGSSIVVKTYKDADKYGRWLAEIYVGDLLVNGQILADGLANPYFGGTKLPQAS
jgi:micrococcal nuclease